MSVLSVEATAVWQQTSVPDVHLAMVFLGIIALALVLQAIGVLVAVGFAARMATRLDGIATELHERTGPVIDKATTLLNELSPKIVSLTENAEQISYTVRAKVDELGATVSELNETVQGINGRARIQVMRADGIVTEALFATEEISQSIQEGIRVPVRQVAGIIAGVKAAVETLIARSPFRR